MITASGQWRGWTGRAFAAALFAVIVVGYLMPATASLTGVPGDIGDARYNAAVLEHLYRVVTGHGAGLWNPDHFYPFKGVLAFSDNHFGSGVTYVLARLSGLAREQAYNVWFIAGTLLNFASALYVLKRLGLSTAAAALGAFYFAFGLPVPVQDGHAQLVHRFPAPLAVLALWEMFERRRLLDAGRLVFFTVWQFYCSIYLGLFLGYLLAALAVAVMIVHKPVEWATWRANLAAQAASAKLAAVGVTLGSVLALAYLGGHYFLTVRSYNLEHWPSDAVITQMLPRLGSYLLADTSPFLAWLGSDVWVPMRYEHQMFIGFGALIMSAVAIVAAWRGHEPVRGLTRPMLLALAFLFVGTLWIGELSLYYLIAWLPGVNAVRGVSRIIFIMLVPISVLVALGAEVVWRRVGTLRAAVPALAGLAALMAIEPLTVHKFVAPIANWQQRLGAVRALLPPVLPRDAILFVRTPSTDLAEQVFVELDAMLLGQDLGHPVLNGYSAFAPPGYRTRPCASAKDRLRGYSAFTGGADIADYARRVIVLELGACPP